jgi:hypothetical protein
MSMVCLVELWPANAPELGTEPLVKLSRRSNEPR